MPADADRARRLPDRAALLAAAVAGRRRWRDPGAREQARLAVTAVAGDRPDRDRLARAHLAHQEIREELLRRPWMIPGCRTLGAGHLVEARRSGRAVIVSYCHLGPFPGIGVTVGEHTGDVHAVADPWLADPSPGRAEDPRAPSWRTIYDAAGVALVAPEGAVPILRELLRRRAVVVMAFAWPGPTQTEPPEGARGSQTARLAHETGALVVPATRSLRELRLWTRFAPSYDSSRDTDWRRLHDRLTAEHESWITKRPAQLEPTTATSPPTLLERKIVDA